MLEIGSLVDGKYKILSEVGHGGMSIVYMAINEKANKTWAVKEVRKDGVLDFEAVRQGLVVETDILKKLKHPNLPSIVDVIEDDETFLIVMDYIEGRSLSKTLEEYGAQPQEYVIEWAKQLCDVLGYLHSREPAIIYRDMKPANIMLKPDGNLTLIDFGTAREFKEKNLADTTCLGTIGYAAPEQFGGMGQTDARTDIYCLGATLYHLVTGLNPSEPPYEIKPIRQVNPSLSSGLERILLKCTQRNPDDRYQSAAELMYALEHYDEIDEKYRKKQKRKLGTFITTAVMSLVLAISGFALNESAVKKATDTYTETLNEARQAADYNDKINKYKECIEIPNKAGETDAYLGLIQTYKDNDSVFTDDEAKDFISLISNNREALKEDPENYTEICFETGKLYWYNYDSDSQVTKATRAADWFQDALNNAPEGYDKAGIARAYADIGSFYKTIQQNIIEASDRGTYRPLFDNLKELLDSVAADENESEIVRLELLELSRSAIHQYATKFKIDGVAEEEINGLFNDITTILESVDGEWRENPEDVLTIKKNSIQSLMNDTKSTMETAYRTSNGGN